ncbi:AI-2E family transporter [Desulforhopalus singaporensis]|uniref:Predicted PurR-regulated permease PerM n=1 Tax=Desulforhopalus singaporensis TaxID=91360 RepID=A0A1H0V4E5_9BACT|nr:AI-2E family transporter [Desulforhopalus singaporensis]SDP72946.1 Predicted PurR-regulated permease PerM [Desulforhopalus singaporensis]
MKKETVSKITLAGLVVLISGLFLTMIHQFLMAIFMAGLFSATVMPIQHFLTRKFGGHQVLASVVIIVGMVMLVMVPLAFLITIVITQAIAIGQSVTPWVHGFIAEPTTLSVYLEKIPFYDQILPYRDVIIHKAGEMVGTVTTFLVNSLSSFTRVTIEALFSSVIMLYVMFYFLNMGDILLERILYFLPLDDKNEQRLLSRFTSVTKATLKGTLIIGFLQGTICGVGFTLAGIEGSVFWGALMAVASIVPAFGTAIIWLPALVILALMGNFTGVIILAVVCGLIAGNLDNLVRPRLVGKDTEMHDLFVLFGTLGGITMFGILGIIIGPIIAALFITLWEMYGATFREYLPGVEMILRKRAPLDKHRQER